MDQGILLQFLVCEQAKNASFQEHYNYYFVLLRSDKNETYAWKNPIGEFRWLLCVGRPVIPAIPVIWQGSIWSVCACSAYNFGFF